MFAPNKIMAYVSAHFSKEVPDNLLMCSTSNTLRFNGYVMIRVHLSVHTIKSPTLTSAERARDILMVNILNKRTLSILVYNLFQTDSATFPYTGILALS